MSEDSTQNKKMRMVRTQKKRQNDFGPVMNRSEDNQISFCY